MAEYYYFNIRDKKFIIRKVRELELKLEFFFEMIPVPGYFSNGKNCLSWKPQTFIYDDIISS